MNESVFHLEGKTALITGGGTGTGFGIARVFVAAGARVVLSGRTEATLQKAVEALGPNARYIINDVTNLAGLPAFVREIEEMSGPISILVNNAGRHLKKYSAETTDEEFLQVINTNLLSVFALSREVANRLVTHRMTGSIIMITSMAAIMGIDRVVAYTTAKTGMVGLMRGLMADYAKDGIRINAIAPGWIETNMSRKALENDPPRMHKVISRIPVAKMGKPSDIGNAALFLASDASSYINGVHLPVDGGAAMSF